MTFHLGPSVLRVLPPGLNGSVTLGTPSPHHLTSECQSESTKKLLVEVRSHQLLSIIPNVEASATAIKNGLGYELSRRK